MRCSAIVRIKSSAPTIIASPVNFGPLQMLGDELGRKSQLQQTILDELDGFAYAIASRVVFVLYFYCYLYRFVTKRPAALAP